MAFDPVTLGFTAGINAIATNLMKVSVEGGWKKFWQLSQKKRDEFALNFAAPAQEYAARYYERHCLVKTLEMNQPVYLDDIYINVQVLKDDFTRCFASLDNQEKLFRTQRSQSFHVGDEGKRPGIEVANDRRYLMVLGTPGIGKTTFLRKVGLEALKGNKGVYQHDLIPVLLELRSFREDTINLKQNIADEFANCGLSDYQQCTDKLLKEGKLLILLDALDEIPTDRTADVVRKIQDFVSQYPKNRFIASCRIAAYQHNFGQFTDITIADFDDQQIQNFVENWFRARNQIEWGKVCWRKLNSDEHRSTKELAHTPLLLTLICIHHKENGNFAANKATLYEIALQALLVKLDAHKEIDRKASYKDFDSKRKSLMLAEVACRSFVANKLFLQIAEIANMIEVVLKDMLPNEKIIDGRKVIDDIEKHTGILVARDRGIYSFAHLTIQEYLTAQHILDNDISLDVLVNKYLLDRNWREIFILIAGIKPPDRLLQAMEKKIHDCMATEKLQKLLDWVAHIANPNGGDIQPFVKRALAITNANANDRVTPYGANASDRSYNVDGNAYAYAYVNTYADAIVSTYAYTIADGNVDAIADAIAIAKASNVYAIAYGNANADAIQKFIEYARSASQDKIYQNVDLSKLIQDIKRLQQVILGDQASKELHERLAQYLIKIWLKAFQLTPEILDFSNVELKAIDNYLYAIKLMIDCRKAALRVNTSAWEKIESRLLMPKSLHQY